MTLNFYCILYIFEINNIFNKEVIQRTWIGNLKIDEVDYEPFVTIGQKIAKELRENEDYQNSI